MKETVTGLCLSIAQALVDQGLSIIKPIPGKQCRHYRCANDLQLLD